MSLYFFGLISIPEKIKTGRLDLYITKPVNALFHLSFESMDLGSVPLVFASIGLLMYSVAGMDVKITVFKIIGYTFLVMLMLLLHFDTMVILRTIPFFTIQAASIERLEGELITLCMKIPGTLFKGPFKVIFCLILPYGIMATVPSQFITGTLSLSGFIFSTAIVVAYTAFTLAFWNYGLKRYESAGS